MCYRQTIAESPNEYNPPPPPNTQPILSEAVLDQYRENKSSVPPGMTPDKYLEIMVCNIICINVTVHGKGSFVNTKILLRKIFLTWDLRYLTSHTLIIILVQIIHCACVSSHTPVSADDPLPLHHMPCGGGCHGYHGPL